MNLLYITITAARGGASLSLLNLVRGMLDKGHNCSVIFSQSGELIEEFKKAGAKCIVIPFRFLTYPHLRCTRDIILAPVRILLIFENILAMHKIRKICINEKIDIIHTNMSPITIGYRIAHSLKIKHVWHIREYLDKDFGLKPIPTKSYLRSIINKSTSISITKDIANHFMIKHPIIIYNGIINSRQEISKLPKKNYFLYVGNVTKLKGAGDAIEAFVQFAKLNKTTRLIFIGAVTPEYQSILESRAKEKGVLNRVIFEGVQKDVFKFMNECLALIVPSLCEGFGRITAEAMSCGCLVIGRNTGGTKEQFDNGLELCGLEIGLRFETIEELTSHLTNVANRISYSEMIANAHKTVYNLYTTENYINNVAKLYK